MHIRYGIYHFGNKRGACRNDYCGLCRKERLALGWRAIHVLHIFYVPLVLLGWWRRWYCSHCQNPTTVSRLTHPAFVLLVTFAFAAFAVTFAKYLYDEDDTLVAALLALLGVVMFGGCVYTMLTPAFAEYRRAVKAVVPLPTDRCPLCHEPVMIPGRPHCDRCQLDICR